MRSDKEMAKLFDEARASGKTFEEALEISGYKEVLDEKAIEDFREMVGFFDEVNELLDDFEKHPEWDREMLTPLREKLEQSIPDNKAMEDEIER